MLPAQSPNDTAPRQLGPGHWDFLRLHFDNLGLPRMEGQPGHTISLDVPGLWFVHRHLRLYSFHGGMDGLEAGILAGGICETCLWRRLRNDRAGSLPIGSQSIRVD